MLPDKHIKLMDIRSTYPKKNMFTNPLERRQYAKLRNVMDVDAFLNIEQDVLNTILTTVDCQGGGSSVEATDTKESYPMWSTVRQ